MTSGRDYQIATSLNNAAGLQDVETAFSTYKNRPVVVSSPGIVSQGVKRDTPAGGIATSGKQIVEWRINVLSEKQYDEFQDTYATDTGGMSGDVTIRTRVDNTNTFANYSAKMRLPDRGELEKRNAAKAFLDVVITFTIQAAL
jgi:hypothetical protein